jgi:hypothetical protein
MPKTGAWLVSGWDTSVGEWSAALVLDRNIGAKTNSGFFEWQIPSNNSFAREIFKGTFDPKARKLTLTGTELINKKGPWANSFACATYVATLSPDGHLLVNGSWTDAPGTRVVPGVWTAVWKAPSPKVNGEAPKTPGLYPFIKAPDLANIREATSQPDRSSTTVVGPKEEPKPGPTPEIKVPVPGDKPKPAARGEIQITITTELGARQAGEMVELRINGQTLQWALSYKFKKTEQIKIGLPKAGNYAYVITCQTTLGPPKIANLIGTGKGTIQAQDGSGFQFVRGNPVGDTFLTVLQKTK